jgi:hypothetical protein
MARPLLIADPQNATIEELKQVSRVGTNETATRCTAIQMLLAGANRDLVCNPLLFNNYVCKNEEKLLERLDQAILDVINNPKKTQKNYMYRNVIMTNALSQADFRVESIFFKLLSKVCRSCLAFKSAD